MAWLMTVKTLRRLQACESVEETCFEIDLMFKDLKPDHTDVIRLARAARNHYTEKQNPYSWVRIEP